MNVEIGNKYELLHEIKRGGFGVIYKGIDRHLGRAVAIKSIDSKFLGEARYIDMFQREAMSIAQLNHHNIVQIYDIKRDASGQMYIIMEYIDGPDLMSVMQACRRKKISIPTHLSVFLISEVCNGLDYAHNRHDAVRGEPLKTVHQDISPLNLMISRLGELKIIDFGMANLRRQQSKVGSQVFVQGNIHYMAPEQVNGSTEVDRRADIFSTGLILFELITGERLIKSTHPREILESLVTGNWDVIRFNSERIAEKLREPIRRALEHHPRNRYPNANSFYRDLMNYLQGVAPASDFMGELAGFIKQVENAPSTDTTAADWVNLQNQKVNDTIKIPALNEIAHPNALPPSSLGVQATNAFPATVPQVHENDETGNHANHARTGTALGASRQPSSDEYSSRYYSVVAESDDDGQRTIIDVVRLSARTHKKAVTIGALSLVLLSMLFVAVDTFAHFTRVGTGVFDFLFPPAIKIVSVPEGAQIYLDDELLNETTPLSLEKISPGVHKLMLTLPQFEPIVKSINVPRSGGIRVAGEAQRHASQPYIFRFKNLFEFASEPPGAEIIIDGVTTNQKTPATVFWEATEKPLDIELEVAGLPRLSGLRINTIEGKEFIEDRRFWNVDRIVPGKQQFNIKGTFHKSITINSLPERADIHLDSNPKPIGVTGLNGELFLKLGEHQVTLSKNGYLERTFNLAVNESTPAVINHELGRAVRIFARDAVANDDRDLGAELVELAVNGRATAMDAVTPTVLELLPKTYTIKLRKPGYIETFLEIPPDETTVIAKMHPLVTIVKIQVLDAITSDPIKSAKLLYNEDRGPASGVFGTTDARGEIEARLAPGFYQITIEKDGYQQQVKTLRVRSDQENRLIFRLTLAR